jgi:hypothetical protein
MPNQNQTDTGQGQQQNPSASVPFSPQADLPPLPPEFQNVNDQGSAPTAPPTTPTVPETPGSAAPPKPDFSNIGPSPKKKFGGGRIIATILGILVLVGGVGAGVFLAQNQQLLKQKAAGESCDNSSITAAVCRGKNDGYVVDSHWTGSCGSSPQGCNNGIQLVCKHTSGTYCAAVCECAPAGGGGKTWPPIGAACHTTGGQAGSIGGFRTIFCPNGCSGGGCTESVTNYWHDYGSSGEAESALDGYCGQIDTTNSSHTYCIPDGNYYDSKIQCTNCTNPPPKTPVPTPTITPTPTPTATPTPTPTPTATPLAPYCVAVTTYSSTWVEIPADERPSIEPGENIYFCVSGAQGTFDMARFTITINDVKGEPTETVTKRPSSSDFCLSYTIPSGNITVTGEIHDPVHGWIGGGMPSAD